MSEREVHYTERRINLEPEDWFWATWRDLEPLPEPAPQPFDLEDALARLASAGGSSSDPWNWSAASVLPVLSREEAHFWFAAISLAGSRATLETLTTRPGGLTFDGEVPLRRVWEALETPYWRVPGEFLLPLRNLFTLEELVEVLLECDTRFPLAQGRDRWFFIQLIDGFRAYVLPYLKREQARALHGQVGAAVGRQQWPSHPSETPPLVFYLAACLGLHEEVRGLVESWKDGLYRSESDGYYHRPLEILFGLGGADEVEAQMRRLKLRLNDPVHIRAWLAHTEYAGLAVIGDSIRAQTRRDRAEQLMKSLELVEAPETAPVMLELMLQPRTARRAGRWLDAHPAQTIAGLTPVATGRGRAAAAALDQLRSLARNGHEARVRASIRCQPGAAAERVEALLFEEEDAGYPPYDDRTTPEWLRAAGSPAAGARLPGWLDLHDLPSIPVGEYRLNDIQVKALLEALRTSTLANPHPLTVDLKAHADRLALDAFAWRLLELWGREGTPAAGKWALIAVGLLGSDPAALKLGPLVRTWRQQCQHQRAALGLECLRAIGTDTALIQLHGFTEISRYISLRELAVSFLREIAEERGLTAEQLEDRMIPDCGLDERGSRAFDYGPRQFRFVMGPGMKPMLQDERGKLRPNLPQPAAKDDAALAKRARTEWNVLKQQVTQVAKVQTGRLEEAMLERRRWSREEFETLFARHPLMMHMARLLVWGVYERASGGRETMPTTFRVTEDGSYADARDQPLEPDGGEEVGLPHPLEVPEETRAAWIELQSDYEIVPPFEQMGRAVYCLEPEETEALEITRFAGIRVPAIVLMTTLEGLRWVRGKTNSDDLVTQFSRPFTCVELTAIVTFEPGIDLLRILESEVQEIGRCYFVPGLHELTGLPADPKVPAGEVDPIMMSEILRDLSILTARGR
jgi:uncharacterized protein DUF4132